jgi:LCP family protein required for cell wall assembly
MTKKIFIIILFIIDIIAVLTCLFLRYLSSNTHTDLLYFPKLLFQTQKPPTLSPGFNFMILGLDPRNDSLEKTETTDTIIFANLSPKLKINLVPIPRDLWDYYLNTKINQIYPLSIGRTDQFPYIQNQYQQLTGQKIDRTVVITTQNLIDLVKLIGGVDVYLDKGFVDNQYPNPAYIVNPSPEISKYITIEFPQGKVNLNESNVTQFVRSRKSADTAILGGTDLGRIERQQLLIDALLNKLKSYDYIHHPQLLFNLYNFFHSDLQTNFTDSDLFGLGCKTYNEIKNISLNKILIPTGEDPKNDLIYHPKTFINSQWVYITQDKDYRRFQEFIGSSIQGNQ